MKKIFIITISLLPMLTQAQVKANANLKTLIAQSFTYFPKIKEVENTVATAQQKLVITQLNKQPDVTADASYNFIQPKITIPINGVDFQFAPVHSLNTAINANYMLFDFGRLKANIERSKTDIQLAQHNVELTKQTLAYQVATVYYNIVYLQKAISIQDSVLAYLNENKQIVESKLRNGDALKIDLLNIQASIDAALNQKVDLQNSLQKQINLLEYTTGVKQSKGTQFDFDINFTDVTSALSQSQNSNMEFVLLKDKILQAQQDLETIKLGDKPTVMLRAATGVKNGYVPNVGEMRFNYIAGVSFSIPIYNGGKTKQQVKLSQTLVKQNELAVETLSNTYKKDIQQALTDVATNLERIKNTDGQIEQANAAKLLAASRFKNGVGTNLEITNASTNVQRAAFTKLQYEYQLCLSKVELAKLMGYPYWQ
jgi:outer membrane protein TolC